MNPDHNKAVVQEFDDVGYGNGDLGRLDYLCTPDMGNHALAPGAKPGIEGTRDFASAPRRPSGSLA
jgi:hypothetical protein